MKTTLTLVAGALLSLSLAACSTRGTESVTLSQPSGKAAQFFTHRPVAADAYGHDAAAREAGKR